MQIAIFQEMIDHLPMQDQNGKDYASPTSAPRPDGPAKGKDGTVVDTSRTSLDVLGLRQGTSHRFSVQQIETSDLGLNNQTVIHQQNNETRKRNFCFGSTDGLITEATTPKQRRTGF
jgi:hypothetical protein